MKLPLSTALLVFYSCTSLAATPSAPTPARMLHGALQKIDGDSWLEHVTTLASDEFEGRAPGTRGETLTIDYLQQQFRKLGLEPGNPDGTYLQRVPTVGISSHPTMSYARDGHSTQLIFGDDYVAWSARAERQIEVTDSELVFVGYGVQAPEYRWDDYKGADLKGKTLLMLINDPPVPDPRHPKRLDPAVFGGNAMTYYGRWAYKYEMAAKMGAAGALIVHDTFPAAYGWNVVNSSWTGAQYYVQSANDGQDQPRANGWVQKPVAEAIFKAAGKDFAALSAAAKTKGFKAVPLGLKADLSFTNAIRKSNSHNVVGILPGTARPDEYVLYTAHWDHLGRCTPDATGDDICNGALDNATGVAALTALAKANVQAGAAPRSQVFMAVTLEESGLLGSEYYAANPIYPLSRTVGGVNMDGLAPTGPTRDVTVTGGDKSELSDVMRPVLAVMNLRVSPEAHPERGSYYRSDHFSLAKRGVPMFAIGKGNDLVIGGVAAGEAASEDYTRNRYHQPSDEYSDAWDFTGIAQQAELYFRLGRALAESDAWPNWRATDEFRATRDKACAADAGGC